MLKAGELSAGAFCSVVGAANAGEQAGCESLERQLCCMYQRVVGWHAEGLWAEMTGQLMAGAAAILAAAAAQQQQQPPK